jgi:cell division protein FtsQ
MKKTKKKKRRLRVGRLILLFLIIGAISFSCYKFIDVPIRSIEITGNEILSDSEIIKAASLDNDPSFFSVISMLVKNKLKENPYIKDAKVSKEFLSIKIKVKEKKVLYIKKDTGEKVMIDSVSKDEKEVCAPFLTNEVPAKKQSRFLKAMNKLNKSIICQMSEIKYDPNDIDSDRYYVYMNDDLYL